MPYRLHISEDEVRDELRRLGYGEVPQDMVVSFRHDLLRLIKADIKQLKKARSQQSESYDTSGTSSYDGTHTSAASTEASLSQENVTSCSTKSSSAFPRAHSQPSLTANTSSPSTVTSTQNNGHSTYSSGMTMPSSAQGLQRRLNRKAQKRSGERDDVYLSSEEEESGYSDYNSSATASSSATGGASHRSSSYASSSGVSSGSSSGSSGLTSRVSQDLADGRSRQDLADGRSRQDLADGRSRPVSGRERGDAAKRAPSLPSYPRRPDPVSLYHYYKAHWKLHPAPGEDPRMSLRWQVRADLFYSK